MAIGDLGAAIDSLSIGNPGSGQSRGDICHATGDFFAAIWFNLTNKVLTLVTFECTTAGVIPSSVQDSIDVPTSATTYPSLIKVADGVVALAYRDGTSSEAKIATYSIDSSGNFGACDPIDTQAITSASGAWTNIFKTQHTDLYVILYGTTFLLASSFTIDSSGNISTVIEKKTLRSSVVRADSWAFGVWTGVDDYYAFAYTQNADNDGFLVTFTIDSCGNFGSSETDRHEFATSQGEFISINSNDNGTLILAYEGSFGAGDVKTVLVDSCGQMTNGTKIDIGSTNEYSILRIDEVDKNTFVLANTSTLKTFTIDACDVPSEVSTLTHFTEFSQRTVLHPGRDRECGILVGVGWDTGLTEFFVWSVGIHTNISETPNGLLPDATKDSKVIVDALGDVILHDTCHANNEWFAIVYAVAGNSDIKMSTFTVDALGNIGLSLQDTITLQTCDVGGSSITKVVEGVVVVSTRFGTGDCPTGIVIETYTIGTDGQISCSPVDTQTITTNAARQFVNVAKTNHDTVFAVLWADNSDLDVEMSTVTIDSSGNISTVVDSITALVAQVGLNQRIDMVWTGVSDYYAIGYQGSAKDGFITTFDIDSSGNIGCPVDTIEFNTFEATDVTLSSNEDGTLVVAYDDDFSFCGSGQIESITVDACGVMTQVDAQVYNVSAAQPGKTLLWMGALNPKLFIKVDVGAITCWELDDCDNLKLKDTIDVGASIIAFPSISIRPCSNCFLVGGVKLTFSGPCDESDITVFTVCFDNTAPETFFVPFMSPVMTAATLRFFYS